MKRIVVLNPKGGSGKTTLAINLASYYASCQQKPVLMDFDPQGSSLRWVRKRQAAQPPIHVIAAFENDARTTRAFQLRIPAGTTHVIVDTPAAIDSAKLPDITRGADKIIVPVLPSDIDIHACSRCIRDLLLVAKIRRGVIPNRFRCCAPARAANPAGTRDSREDGGYSRLSKWIPRYARSSETKRMKKIL